MAKDQLMDLEKALELFEPVLGFEVHVELSTDTKMFSAAPNPAAMDEATVDPNTCITPLCLGLPGSLPVVNEKAVEYSISLGISARV
jgi:aspartyl-tRNA(Asn)/glutamyl-tRNA(Gln) amidotransferase subunit B